MAGGAGRAALAQQPEQQQVGRAARRAEQLGMASGQGAPQLAVVLSLD